MTAPDPTPAFDFGANWAEFSTHALTPERIEAARAAFRELLRAVPLAGRTFLDIGFGQGMSLLFAAAEGARTVGCDINPRCLEVLQANAPRLLPPGCAAPHLVCGSILSDSTVQALRQAPVVAAEGYDIVHSWGVLHHTGQMWKAIETAAGLVRPGGHLILALYNLHWSCRPWWHIKRAYNRAPSWIRPLLVYSLVPVIFAAKWAVTRRNPLRQQRGMDFYYNVVDWVGGYPYEYCAISEPGQRLGPAFEEIQRTPAEVPTGCHELVFRRRE